MPRRHPYGRLAAAERIWFGHHLTGAELQESYGLDMNVPADRSAEDVLRDCRAAIAESDTAILAAGDPEVHLAKLVDGERLTLRWLLTHMTTETARHAGHADILREQIDGTTGR